MNSVDSEKNNSRRSFLRSSGGWMSAAWVAAHWPSIADAARHADHMTRAAEPAGFEYFNAADAADIEAVSSQIVPSGATAGARDVHAIYFIDRALATFLASWAADFRPQMEGFQAKFRAENPTAGAFAKLGSDAQIAYLKTVDGTRFFETVRMLTILGMFTSPQYGGNFRGSGWKMMGFVDQHAFTPPFGYYDREYTGFVPYPGTTQA